MMDILTANRSENKEKDDHLIVSKAGAGNETNNKRKNHIKEPQLMFVMAIVNITPNNKAGNKNDQVC